MFSPKRLAVAVSMALVSTAGLGAAANAFLIDASNATISPVVQAPVSDVVDGGILSDLIDLCTDNNDKFNNTGGGDSDQDSRVCKGNHLLSDNTTKVRAPVKVTDNLDSVSTIVTAPVQVLVSLIGGLL